MSGIDPLAAALLRLQQASNNANHRQTTGTAPEPSDDEDCPPPPGESSPPPGPRIIIAPPHPHGNLSSLPMGEDSDSPPPVFHSITSPQHQRQQSAPQFPQSPPQTQLMPQQQFQSQAPPTPQPQLQPIPMQSQTMDTWEHTTITFNNRQSQSLANLNRFNVPPTPTPATPVPGTPAQTRGFQNKYTRPAPPGPSALATPTVPSPQQPFTPQQQTQPIPQPQPHMPLSLSHTASNQSTELHQQPPNTNLSITTSMGTNSPQPYQSLSPRLPLITHPAQPSAFTDVLPTVSLPSNSLSPLQSRQTTGSDVASSPSGAQLSQATDSPRCDEGGDVFSPATPSNQHKPLNSRQRLAIRAAQISQEEQDQLNSLANQHGQQNGFKRAPVTGVGSNRFPVFQAPGGPVMSSKSSKFSAIGQTQPQNTTAAGIGLIQQQTHDENHRQNAFEANKGYGAYLFALNVDEESPKPPTSVQGAKLTVDPSLGPQCNPLSTAISPTNSQVSLHSPIFGGKLGQNAPHKQFVLDDDDGIDDNAAISVARVNKSSMREQLKRQENDALTINRINRGNYDETTCLNDDEEMMLETINPLARQGAVAAVMTSVYNDANSPEQAHHSIASPTNHTNTVRSKKPTAKIGLLGIFGKKDNSHDDTLFEEDMAMGSDIPGPPQLLAQHNALAVQLHNPPQMTYLVSKPKGKDKKTWIYQCRHRYHLFWISESDRKSSDKKHNIAHFQNIRGSIRGCGSSRCSNYVYSEYSRILPGQTDTGCRCETTCQVCDKCLLNYESLHVNQIKHIILGNGGDTHGATNFARSDCVLLCNDGSKLHWIFPDLYSRNLFVAQCYYLILAHTHLITARIRYVDYKNRVRYNPRNEIVAGDWNLIYNGKELDISSEKYPVRKQFEKNAKEKQLETIKVPALPFASPSVINGSSAPLPDDSISPTSGDNKDHIDDDAISAAQTSENECLYNISKQYPAPFISIKRSSSLYSHLLPISIDNLQAFAKHYRYMNDFVDGEHTVGYAGGMDLMALFEYITASRIFDSLGINPYDDYKRLAGLPFIYDIPTYTQTFEQPLDHVQQLGLLYSKGLLNNQKNLLIGDKMPILPSPALASRDITSTPPSGLISLPGLAAHSSFNNIIPAPPSNTDSIPITTVSASNIDINGDYIFPPINTSQLPDVLPISKLQTSLVPVAPTTKAAKAALAANPPVPQHLPLEILKIQQFLQLYIFNHRYNFTSLFPTNTKDTIALYSNIPSLTLITPKQAMPFYSQPKETYPVSIIVTALSSQKYPIIPQLVGVKAPERVLVRDEKERTLLPSARRKQQELLKMQQDEIKFTNSLLYGAVVSTIPGDPNAIIAQRSTGSLYGDFAFPPVLQFDTLPLMTTPPVYVPPSLNIFTSTWNCGAKAQPKPEILREWLSATNNGQVEGLKAQRIINQRVYQTHITSCPSAEQRETGGDDSVITNQHALPTGHGALLAENVIGAIGSDLIVIGFQENKNYDMWVQAIAKYINDPLQQQLAFEYSNQNARQYQEKVRKIDSSARDELFFSKRLPPDCPLAVAGIFPDVSIIDETPFANGKKPGKMGKVDKTPLKNQPTNNDDSDDDDDDDYDAAEAADFAPPPPPTSQHQTTATDPLPSGYKPARKFTQLFGLTSKKDKEEKLPTPPKGVTGDDLFRESTQQVLGGHLDNSQEHKMDKSYFQQQNASSLSPAGPSTLRYELVINKAYWEMGLCVFVKADLVHLVAEKYVETVATGIGGVIGNKGAVGAYMNFCNTPMLFISSHMVAREERLPQRNQNFQRIINELSTKLAPKLQHVIDMNGAATAPSAAQLSKFGATHQPCTATSSSSSIAIRELLSHCDVILWLGDLNYRVICPFEDAVHYCKTNNLQPLAACDQLTYERATWRTFVGFEEGPLNFTPTYRWNRGETSFSNKRAQPPSWTDRVLYKRQTADMLQLVCYGARHQCLVSDHRPVVAAFTFTPNGMNLASARPLVPANSNNTVLNNNPTTIKQIKEVSSGMNYVPTLKRPYYEDKFPILTQLSHDQLTQEQSSHSVERSLIDTANSVVQQCGCLGDCMCQELFILPLRPHEQEIDDSVAKVITVTTPAFDIELLDMMLIPLTVLQLTKTEKSKNKKGGKDDKNAKDLYNGLDYEDDELFYDEYRPSIQPASVGKDSEKKRKNSLFNKSSTPNTPLLTTGVNPLNPMSNTNVNTTAFFGDSSLSDYSVDFVVNEAHAGFIPPLNVSNSAYQNINAPVMPPLIPDSNNNSINVNVLTPVSPSLSSCSSNSIPPPPPPLRLKNSGQQPVIVINNGLVLESANTTKQLKPSNHQQQKDLSLPPPAPSGLQINTQSVQSATITNVPTYNPALTNNLPFEQHFEVFSTTQQLKMYNTPTLSLQNIIEIFGFHNTVTAVPSIPILKLLLPFFTAINTPQNVYKSTLSTFVGGQVVSYNLFSKLLEKHNIIDGCDNPSSAAAQQLNNNSSKHIAFAFTHNNSNKIAISPPVIPTQGFVTGQVITQTITAPSDQLKQYAQLYQNYMNTHQPQFIANAAALQQQQQQQQSYVDSDHESGGPAASILNSQQDYGSSPPHASDNLNNTSQSPSLSHNLLLAPNSPQPPGVMLPNALLAQPNPQISRLVGSADSNNVTATNLSGQPSQARGRSGTFAPISLSTLKSGQYGVYSVQQPAADVVKSSSAAAGGIDTNSQSAANKTETLKKPDNSSMLIHRTTASVKNDGVNYTQNLIAAAADQAQDSITSVTNNNINNLEGKIQTTTQISTHESQTVTFYPVGHTLYVKTDCRDVFSLANTHVTVTITGTLSSKTGFSKKTTTEVLGYAHIPLKSATRAFALSLFKPQMKIKDGKPVSGTGTAPKVDPLVVPVTNSSGVLVGIIRVGVKLVRSDRGELS